MPAKAQQAALPGTTATASWAALVALPRAPASSRIWRMLSIQSESSSHFMRVPHQGVQTPVQVEDSLQKCPVGTPPFGCSDYRGVAQPCTERLNTLCPHVCRAKTTGEGAGWIGGVPGRNDVVQTWLCQPGGNTPCPSITDATTCPADQLKASLQCPDPSCNAKAVSYQLQLHLPGEC